MVTIGCSGAIHALVQLLSNGSQRGKKDAATALFNLCSIYQGNKGKAVRAGLVPILPELLMESESGMVDEALAILALDYLLVAERMVIKIYKSDCWYP